MRLIGFVYFVEFVNKRELESLVQLLVFVYDRNGVYVAVPQVRSVAACL